MKSRAAIHIEHNKKLVIDENGLYHAILCQFDPFQYNILKKISNDELTTRPQVSNIVFPTGKITDDGFYSVFNKTENKDKDD